jgi:hypothetical protein
VKEADHVALARHRHPRPCDRRPCRVFLLEALDVWQVRAVVPLAVMLVGFGVAIIVGALWKSGRARMTPFKD